MPDEGEPHATPPRAPDVVVPDAAAPEADAPDVDAGDVNAGDVPGADDAGSEGLPEEDLSGVPRPRIADSAVQAATQVPESRTEVDLDPAEDEDDAPEAAAPDPAADPPDGDAEPTGAAEDAEDGLPPDADEQDESDPDVQAWRALALTTRLEALLFAATAPLSVRRLQTLAGDVEAADVRDALTALASHYEATSRAFGLEEIGGGFQLRTRSELSGLLARLGRKRTSEKLSPAAVETLAIVAYRQPVLRVDVEKIRGVASGEVLRTLVEKGLVRIAGRADLPGAPLLYGTTPAFLEIFGLRDLKDLPNDRELLRAP